MRTVRSVVALALLGLAAAALAQPATLSTAFTFQGQLAQSGSPATGVFDIQFALFDSTGAQLGPTLCSNNVTVSGGLLTAQVDFGSQFEGHKRFLEVRVRADTGQDCSNSTGLVI